MAEKMGIVDRWRQAKTDYAWFMRTMRLMFKKDATFITTVAGERVERISRDENPRGYYEWLLGERAPIDWRIEFYRLAGAPIGV